MPSENAKIARSWKYKDDNGNIHEYAIGSTAENVLMPDGSTLADSTIFDYVVKDQASFDKLIASPTWLDAKNVLIDGSGATGDGYTISNAVTIPDTVLMICGINGASIRTSSADGSMGYASKMTEDKYSIINISFKLPMVSNLRNLYNVEAAAINNSVNIMSCKIGGPATNCSNLINCKGFQYVLCDRLINCYGNDFFPDILFDRCTNIFTTEEFVKSITGELDDLQTSVDTNLVAAINSLNSNSFQVHPGIYTDPDLCYGIGIYYMSDMSNDICGSYSGTLISYESSGGVQVFISSDTSVTTMSYRTYFGASMWNNWVPLTGLIKEVGFGDTANAFMITRETDHLSIRYKSNS